jgi:hypothetical protein
MKRAILLIVSFFSFSFFFAGSCKKPHNNVTGGGKGGNATIIARAEHYRSLLDTAIIYVKYGTLNAPVNGVYDDSIRVGSNYQAVFTNLTTGNYYFFAEGIHDPYNPPTVDGGKAWVINSSTETDTVNVTTTQQNFVYPFL